MEKYMTDNDIWNNDLERTRSLYHTEESSRRNSLTDAIAQSPGTIRKSMGRIVKGEGNKTKADMASQIRDDDNIFIIDPSLYDDIILFGMLCRQ